jgi:peptidoglycan/LPS O-acetylase OafA/YrhL
MSEREASLDALRVVGVYAVTFIHAALFEVYGADGNLTFFLDELWRFAVPMFFILAGYFWRIDAAGQISSKVISRTFNRVMPAFVGWLIVYSWLGHRGYLLPEMTGSWPTVLALVDGGAGIHLWYLPALVTGAAISLLLLRFGLVPALLFAGAFYALGTIVGTYARGLFGIDVSLVVYRNGLFMAPLLLLIGVMLRLAPATWKKLTTRAWIGGAILGLAVHLVEGLLADSYPFGHDYSAGTILMSVSLVALALRNPFQNSFVCRAGDATFVAYLVHWGVICLLFGLFGQSIIMALVSATLSIAIGMIYNVVKSSVQPIKSVASA